MQPGISRGLIDQSDTPFPLVIVECFPERVALWAVREFANLVERVFSVFVGLNPFLLGFIANDRNAAGLEDGSGILAAAQFQSGFAGTDFSLPEDSGEGVGMAAPSLFLL